MFYFQHGHRNGHRERSRGDELASEPGGSPRAPLGEVAGTLYRLAMVNRRLTQRAFALARFERTFCRFPWRRAVPLACNPIEPEW